MAVQVQTLVPQAEVILRLVLLAVLVLLWAWRAAGMAQPRYGKSLMLKPLEGGTLSSEQLVSLQALAGVDELVVMPDEAVIYLKVDPRMWSDSALADWPVKILPT